MPNAIWKCPNCGKQRLKSNFCPDCGTERPKPQTHAATLEEKQAFEAARKSGTLKSWLNFDENFPDCDLAAQAQIKIAALYYEGKGVKQNYEEALKWTIKAAKNEDPLLLLYIGTVYYNGHGVKKDYTEALNWFVKAAEHGNAEAQYNVGSMYARGEGTAYDLKKALEWFLKAAEQGFAAAEQALDILVNEETAFDYDEARKWLQKKAEHGDINSLIILGESYLGKKNYAEAVKCFQKAAEQGNAEGQFYFASCCHEGCGIQQDNEKAKFWFQKAAEQGNEEAAEALKDLNRGRTILYITTGGVKMFSEIKETEPLKSTNKQKDQ